MNIDNINLQYFRSYENLSLDLSDGINIFTGLNAQGKTNIIEAVRFAALGISHRTRNDSDLIYWDHPEAKIDITFSKMGVESELVFFLKRGARKRIELNGMPLTQKNLLGSLTMVLFSPEDLLLVKGSPLLRRRFLDIELSQVSLVYYSELVRYNKILLQRNSLLKKIRERSAPPDMLDMWDGQFAHSAAFIAAKRISGVQRLNALAEQIHSDISGAKEKLSVQYVIQKHEDDLSTGKEAVQLESWYEKMLKGCRREDILRGSTSIGPHRDDISLELNGVNLKSFGSQGQQRSSVLSLKLSELEFLHSETGEYPVLLLDDVMSELDAARRDSLIGILQQRHIQTLITATDRSLFGSRGENRFFTVQKGFVTE